MGASLPVVRMEVGVGVGRGWGKLGNFQETPGCLIPSLRSAFSLQNDDIPHYYLFTSRGVRKINEAT